MYPLVLKVPFSNLIRIKFISSLSTCNNSLCSNGGLAVLVHDWMNFPVSVSQKLKRCHLLQISITLVSLVKVALPKFLWLNEEESLRDTGHLINELSPY